MTYPIVPSARLYASWFKFVLVCSLLAFMPPALLAQTVLSVSAGGTGAATFTGNAILTGNGTDALNAASWLLSSNTLTSPFGGMLVDNGSGGLTLTGASGAQLVLGQGANSNIILTPSGTGVTTVNAGTGGAAILTLAGPNAVGGNAVIDWTAGGVQQWSSGVRHTGSNWVLNNSTNLAGTDEVMVTTTGLVTFAGNNITMGGGSSWTDTSGAIALSTIASGNAGITLTTNGSSPVLITNPLMSNGYTLKTTKDGTTFAIYHAPSSIQLETFSNVPLTFATNDALNWAKT